MNFIHEFECVDPFGNTNRFKYSKELSEDGDFEKVIYRVIPADTDTNDWFEFSVAKIDDTTGKVSSMNNNKVPELRGKGITEKLIELAASELGLHIISSSNKLSSKKLETEWRSIDASRVWDRLVQQNKANYDSELDVYSYCP